MKQTLFSVLVLFFFATTICSAATFDITTYTPPSGWKEEQKQGVVVYSTTNESGGYCIIGVYKSKESSGNLKADFDVDWREILVTPFQIANPPQLEPVQERDGWQMQVGASNFTNEAGTAAALLTTATGHGKKVSVFVILNDQKYMTAVEQFLDSLQFAKPTPTGTQTRNPITGVWTKSAASPWGVAPGTVLTNAGYYKIRYEFQADGTYRFKGESWGGAMRSNVWWTIEENGTYTIAGDSVTISPAASRATLRDSNGNVQETRNNPLEKVTYGWSLHFFEGIGETNLVLKPPAQTTRDGGFAGNSDFPNSYLLSANDRLEWRY